MYSKINEIAKNAHELVDLFSDYQIPRIRKIKTKPPSGKRWVACQKCGAPFLGDKECEATHCMECRKIVTKLFRERNKKYPKNTDPERD